MWQVKFLVVTLLVAFSSTAFPDEVLDMQLRIEQQMAAADRHAWDLRRDAPRKPLETFVFLGVREGMVAMDIGAYAGYTTEMFAAAVGPDGKVYMQNTKEVIEEYAKGYYERTISQQPLAERRFLRA